MSTRKTKRLSGSQYRKRKLEKEEERKQMAGAFKKFLKTDDVPAATFERPLPHTTQPDVDSSKIKYHFEVTSVDLPSTSTSTETPDLLSQSTASESQLQIVTSEEENLVLSEDHNEVIEDGDNYGDPATWKHPIQSTVRRIIIENGPVQVTKKKFPADLKGRKFSKIFYKRTLSNGETINRSWLIYSEKNNSVYCFCCKLFCIDDKKMKLTSTGFNDWQHLSNHLKRHETSSTHIKNYNSLVELKESLQKGVTIDATNQKLFEMKQRYWFNVLERMLYIVQFLSRQCLAFRGKQSKLFQPNNGNFLKLLEMLSKFDQVTSDHLKKVSQSKNTNKRAVLYVGPRIQNELINIMASAVRNKIVDEIRKAKYYSIILDCTPDKSKIEQISLIIRYVAIEKVNVEIKESFIAFYPVTDTTGRGLSEFVLNELSNLHLDMDNLRGQGYDNGSNMKGKNCGLQKLILNKNSRAFFVPCSSHSLNLVANDAAKASNQIVNFFLTVQNLYNYFSSSTQRWHILKNNIKSLTLKQVSETRWESRIDAIRPLIHEMGGIYDSLEEIGNDNSKDASMRLEAIALAKKIQNFNFICSAFFWYELLLKINVVSEQLQNKQINLQSALSLLKNLKSFIKECRTDEFFNYIIEQSKKIAEEIDANSEFEVQDNIVRIRRKKRNFDYEAQDEPLIDKKQQFKVNCFYIVLDQIYNSLEERYRQTQNLNIEFGFLYNLQFYSQPENSSELLGLCKNLETKLTDINTNESDIDYLQLYEEIRSLTLPDISSNDVGSILNYIVEKGFNEIYPNLTIAIRILLTLPVTVASAERSFSKLKIVKNYLRSTMAQERLSNLSLLSIEHTICETLDFSILIKEFANTKARRAKF